MLLVFASGSEVFAEKMPEKAEFKAKRIEKELTLMFVEAAKAAVAELAEDYKINPYAFVLKADGSMGYFTSAEDKADVGVLEQGEQIRRMLKDLARTNQINASIQAMYATIANGENSVQGIVFEIEHREGVSIKRFLPLEKELDDAGQENGKYLLNTSKMKTSKKPIAVFAEL